MPRLFPVGSQKLPLPLICFMGLNILLSLVPGLIAGWLNDHPGEHGEDREILSAWTYCQIALMVFLVYIYRMPLREPVVNVTAIFATMTPFAFFMQKLGAPIGLRLAESYIPLVGPDGRSTFAASFTHHFGTGLITYLLTGLLCWLAHSRYLADLARPTRTGRASKRSTPLYHKVAVSLSPTR